jgi:hypothetical protein
MLAKKITSFFKGKIHKEVTKQKEIKVFLAILLDDGRIRIRTFE